MMRHSLSLALAGSMVMLSAAAQAEGVKYSPEQQQVLTLLDDWATAENKHDAAALGRILDDQFISTFNAGKPTRKDAFIKALTHGNADPRQTQLLTDETVIVEGDTAVVVGTNIFPKSGTRTTPLNLRFTITFARRDAHWVALAEHIVKMPD